jgi:hypothetical protein
MWKFDIHSMEWKCVIKENSYAPPRYGHESFVIQNKIFMYGGKNSKHELRDVYYCDMNAKNLCWNKISASNFPFDEISGTVYSKCLTVGNCLYFYGGIRMMKQQDSNINFQQLIAETRSQEFEEESKNLLNSLSDDVILQILSFLSIEDIGNVSLVSKKWKFAQLSNCKFCIVKMTFDKIMLSGNMFTFKYARIQCMNILLSKLI